MKLTLGATDRRVFRGPKALDAPVFAPGILTSISVVWVGFCASFSKFAKAQYYLSTIFPRRWSLLAGMLDLLAAPHRPVVAIVEQITAQQDGLGMDQPPELLEVRLQIFQLFRTPGPHRHLVDLVHVRQDAARDLVRVHHAGDRQRSALGRYLFP